jgi:hypothetical protein
MARTGRPRTPDHLKLITGRWRNDRDGRPTQSARSRAFGPLVKPDLQGHAALEAWDLIAKAWWLDRSKEMLAIAACMLWQQFREDPPGFTAAMHGQLRGYLGALGLSDERFRSPPPPEFDDDENYA